MWNEEKLLAEAQKYQTRNSFREGSNSAYITAHRMGLLNTICAHMPKRVNAYSLTKAIAAAKECSSASDLKKEAFFNL